MSHRPHPIRLLLLPVLVAGLLLAGCSDDDGGSDDTDDDTTTTAVDSDDGGSEAPSDATGDGDDDTTSSDPGGQAAGDPTDFCAAVQAADDTFADLDDDTVEGQQARAEALVTALEGLVEVAPDELTDDLDLLIEASTEFRDVIADATDLAEIEAAEDDFLEDPETEAAGDRFDDYVEASCEDDDDGASDDDDDADDGDGAGATPSTVG